MMRSLFGRWQQETRLHRYVFYVVLLLGFALRLAYLFQPVRLDEAIAYVDYARYPLSVITTFYNAPGNHILHSIIVHFSTIIFGNNPVALRLPVFLCGILVLPLTYITFRRIATKEAGLVAMALAAVSSGLINYSTQARGYMLQAAFLLGLVLVGLWLINTDSVKGWIAFTLLAIAGLYTVPTFLYFLPGVFAWVVLSRYFKHYDRRKLVRRSLISAGAICILTFLLYVPAILSSGTDTLLKGDVRYNPGIVRLTFAKFISQAPTNIRQIWLVHNVGVPFILSMILLAGFLLSVLLYKRVTKKAGYNLPLIMLFFMALLYIAQRQAAYTRVFVPAIPLYLGFGSVGICAAWALITEAAKKRTSFRLKPVIVYSTSFALILILVWSVVFLSQGPYQLSDTGDIGGTLRKGQAIVELLKKELRPGDMVMAMPSVGIPILEYYFRENGIPLRYLMMTISKQKDWEADNASFMNNNFTAYTRDKIKRAFYIVAPHEQQGGMNLLAYITTYMGFDLSNFSDGEIIYDNDWATVYVAHRLRTEPLPKLINMYTPESNWQEN